jgi:hypothetical protein
MSKYKSKDEDSDDDFNFDDDEEDEITESKQESSLSTSAAKKPTFPAYSAAKKLNVDDIIKKLLTSKVRNIGLTDELSEQTILDLIDSAKDLFTSQPVFLELTAPVKIVSDIHG